MVASVPATKHPPAGRRSQAQHTLLLRWVVSLILILIGLGATVYRSAILREENRQLVIVIPLGTAAQIEAGEQNTLPHEIELILGVRDVLVIHNEDNTWHRVGPYWVAPGHTLVQRFYQPGTIQGACTMNPSQQVEIVIRERRP